MRVGTAALGRRLRRVARRPDDPSADVRVGSIAVVAALSAAVDVRAALLVAVGAAVLTTWRARADLRMQQTQLAADTPDVIDLLRLAVGSGLNLRLALAAAASRSPPSWRPTLLTIDQRLALGEPLVVSFDDAGRRLGDGAGRHLLRVLAAAERDGTPLLPALTRLADDARVDRRRAGEEAARRLPVKLLFPLVLCVLPAFVLLALAPLLASALGSLRL
jgi:tight adherence protein C